MLVVTLKAEQIVRIGRTTIVRIVRVGPGGEVRLGIEARPSDRISRELDVEKHLERQTQREERYAT